MEQTFSVDDHCLQLNLRWFNDCHTVSQNNSCLAELGDYAINRCLTNYANDTDNATDSYYLYGPTFFIDCAETKGPFCSAY